MKNQQITIIILLAVVCIIFFKLNSNLKEENSFKQYEIDSLKYNVKQDSLFVDSLKILFNKVDHKTKMINDICNEILTNNEELNINQKEMYHSEVESTFYLIEKLVFCRDSAFVKFHNKVKKDLVGK